MGCTGRNSALCFMTFVFASTGICYALAQTSRAISSAIVVRPIKLENGLVNLTAASFANDVTGDLVLRIASAVAATLEDASIEETDQARRLAECASTGAAPAECGGPGAGVLNGNPVNSITVGTFDASDSNSSPNIDVIIAYN